MTNINHSEVEHLNPAYKVEIAPQQTNENQVSSAANALSGYTVFPLLLYICYKFETRSVYTDRSLNRSLSFLNFNNFTALFQLSFYAWMHLKFSISLPLKHFHHFIFKGF